MKKIYSLTMAMLFAGISFSQIKQAQFNGFYQADPNAVLIEENRAVTIWSEDFAGGLPADWGVSTITGPVMWKHTTVGHTGSYPTAPLSSTTSGNGWMIADSDADNFSGGGSEDTRLISPKIDLTGYANVKLEFQQMFRRWQADITTVQISVDSINWTDYVINSSVTQSGTPNPDYVNIDISAIAGNQSTVWVAFWWQGAWDYGWQIDDISIKEILDNDITMKNEQFGTAVEYYKVPLNQVQAFEFSSDVENIGMLAQTGITLDVTVNDGTSNVYTGSSSPLSTLAPWATDSIGIASGYTPTAMGNFTITFEMNQNETDEETTNNTRVKTMQVTDTVYALDNGTYQGQWYNQETGGVSNEYIIGGAYDIYTNDIASSISVYIGSNTDLGTVFETILYEWDGAAWTMVNSSDLVTVTSAHLNSWVHAKLFTGQSLTSGSTYLAAVHHFGGPDFLWVGYSSNSNRGYTQSSDDGISFLNQPRNPMVRLNTGSAVGMKEENKMDVSVFPNPATNNINIQLNGTSNVNAQLTDVTGKVVYTGVINGSVNTINAESFANGIYTLRLQNENNVQSVQIVIAK